jgi:hypothetical protein
MVGERTESRRGYRAQATTVSRINGVGRHTQLRPRVKTEGAIRVVGIVGIVGGGDWSAESGGS